MARPKLRQTIVQALTARGISVTVKRHTICVGRTWLHPNTRQPHILLSAVCVSPVQDWRFRIYAIEKYSSEDTLVRWTIKLNDAAEETKRHYDYTDERGLHIHQYQFGRKIRNHIAVSGSLNDVIEDIAEHVLNGISEQSDCHEKNRESRG